MGRKTPLLTSILLAGLLVLCVVVVAMSTRATAQSRTAEIEGAGYNVNAAMIDNLKPLVGKKVYITLDSGKIIAGSVKAVGGQLVHLEKIEGKEFFDALIRLEKISAIDTRFRGEQR